MTSTGSTELLSPIRRAASDRPHQQDGQFNMEADFMASSAPRAFYNTASKAKKPWRNSLDTQDFNGFASNLEEIVLAPADELFFKGQLLPLQWRHRRNLVQAICPSTHEDEGDASPSASSINHQAVMFNSCRMDALVDTFELQQDPFDMRSSSFRSRQSGFWESGPDKDSFGDTSSSRDSNDSSQDCYFPTEAHHHSNALHRAKVSNKILTLIPWKSLLTRIKISKNHYFPIRKAGFSEDLSHCTEPVSLDEAKKAMRAWNLSIWAQGGRKLPRTQAAIKDGSKSVHLCGTIPKGLEENSHRHSCESTSKKQRGMRADAGECNGVDENELKWRKQRNEKERWPEYMHSKLKPWYEMKKGLMGQFRMDDCGKRAYCEVESGSTCKSRAPLQRRVSHKSSLQKSHKDMIIAHEVHPAYTALRNYNTASLHNNAASHPFSKMHSPIDHGNGLLADLAEFNERGIGYGSKRFTASKGIHYTSGITKITRSSSMTTKKSNSTSNMAFSNNDTGVSTMHELHSAVQSAIAHCKESNKKRDL